MDVLVRRQDLYITVRVRGLREELKTVGEKKENEMDDWREYLTRQGQEQEKNIGSPRSQGDGDPTIAAILSLQERRGTSGCR